MIVKSNRIEKTRKGSSCDIYVNANPKKIFASYKPVNNIDVLILGLSSSQSSISPKLKYRCRFLAFKYVYTFTKWLKILQLDTIESTWLNKRNDNRPQEEEMQRWKMEIQLDHKRDDIYSDHIKVPISNRQSAPTVSRPKWMELIRMLKNRKDW